MKGVLCFELGRNLSASGVDNERAYISFNYSHLEWIKLNMKMRNDYCSFDSVTALYAADAAWTSLNTELEL